jgi:amino acid transporter
MSQPELRRRLGLLHATALNMVNMIGTGPFITIAGADGILATMQGPQALLGWAVGAIIALADGLVVAELGAALPAAGGIYVFLREGFGPARWGRLAAFLFVWQFLFSGPLEVASGCIGLAHYL